MEKIWCATAAVRNTDLEVCFSRTTKGGFYFRIYCLEGVSYRTREDSGQGMPVVSFGLLGGSCGIQLFEFRFSISTSVARARVVNIILPLSRRPVVTAKRIPKVQQVARSRVGQSSLVTGYGNNLE